MSTRRNGIVGIGILVIVAFGFLETTALAAEIHDAALNGKAAEVESILKSDPTQVNAPDDQKRTPLHMAAYAGHKAVCETLLGKGADPSVRANGGVTPLHFAALQGHKDIIALLIAKGADVDIKTDKNSTPLMFAAQMKTDVGQFLLTKGASPKAVSLDGTTPLLQAINGGNTVLAEELIAKGADVNAKQETSGLTPLHGAARQGQKGIVELLIGKGAKVNARDSSQDTPLYHAERAGHHDIAQMLLLHGAEKTSVHAVSDNLSFLTLVNRGDRSSVEASLQKGANVNAKEAIGKTALILASENGDFGIVKVLLAKGADANTKTDQGITALILASQGGYEEIVMALLANKADPNAKDNRGKTALDYAKGQRQERVVQILIKAMETLQKPK